MINQKEEIINYLGRVLFVGLFLLLITAFSEKATVQKDDRTRNELISGNYCEFVKATPVKTISLPFFQKNWLTFIDLKKCRLFNESLKISSDNTKIEQRFIFQRSAELLIKPLIYTRFNFLLFPSTTEEMPVLS